MKKWFKKQHYLFWKEQPVWIKTLCKIHLTVWVGIHAAVILPNPFK